MGTRSLSIRDLYARSFVGDLYTTGLLEPSLDKISLIMKMSTALQQVTRRYEKVARAIARPMFRARLPSKTEDEGTFEALKNEGQVFTPTVQTLQCCHGASLRNSPNIVNGWFFHCHVGPPKGMPR